MGYREPPPDRTTPTTWSLESTSPQCGACPWRADPHPAGLEPTGPDAHRPAPHIPDSGASIPCGIHFAYWKNTVGRKKTVAGPDGAGSSSRTQQSVCNQPAPHMYSNPPALYKGGCGQIEGAIWKLTIHVNFVISDCFHGL